MHQSTKDQLASIITFKLIAKQRANKNTSWVPRNGELVSIFYIRNQSTKKRGKGDEKNWKKRYAKTQNKNKKIKQIYKNWNTNSMFARKYLRWYK